MSTRIITGDALTELGRLAAASVHCCVTSPPYYGLRDYGTATWHGGDSACDHRKAHDMSTSGLGGGKTTTLHAHYHRSVCPCGARRIDAQLGLETTPDAYVAALVAVFRELRRVLRRDGTLWLNIGDSYANGGRKTRDPGQSKIHPAFEGEAYSDGLRPTDPDGIKPKDLIGIPWMLAFALRADGWYLRQDIIWAKPNPMPESVTDRCTKAHEYLFLLSKSERYWFDAAAIADPSAYPGDTRHLRTDNTIEFARPDGGSRARTAQPTAETRNKRSVWTIATAPFSEAHFATFPPALIEPCILAGCPKGGTVLDPFLGAGTTALVADRLGRNAIGIELNPAYAVMARNRIADDAGLFFEAAQ